MQTEVANNHTGVQREGVDNVFSYVQIRGSSECFLVLLEINFLKRCFHPSTSVLGTAGHESETCTGPIS
jgi:hypothetical protein